MELRDRPKLCKHERIEFATNPRAPASIVIVFAVHESCVDVRTNSSSSKYRASFRSVAAAKFSSAGHVSSIKKTSLIESDQRIIYGLWFVAHMCGGNTIWLFLKSTNNFQSTALDKILLLFRVWRLRITGRCFAVTKLVFMSGTHEVCTGEEFCKRTSSSKTFFRCNRTSRCSVCYAANMCSLQVYEKVCTVFYHKGNSLLTVDIPLNAAMLGKSEN